MSHASTTNVYQQCWKEEAGWHAHEGVPNNAISVPKLANIVLQVGLIWLTIGIYNSAISAYLEPHHHHKASNQPIMSRLMCHFYLQHPLTHKQF